MSFSKIQMDIFHKCLFQKFRWIFYQIIEIIIDYLPLLGNVFFQISDGYLEYFNVNDVITFKFEVNFWWIPNSPLR